MGQLTLKGISPPTGSTSNLYFWPQSHWIFNSMAVSGVEITDDVKWQIEKLHNSADDTDGGVHEKDHDFRPKKVKCVWLKPELNGAYLNSTTILAAYRSIFPIAARRTLTPPLSHRMGEGGGSGPFFAKCA
jgi:hypothetical protein